MKLMLTFIAILIVSSIALADPVVISGGPENDYESWIARLNDGRLMVVFDRNPDWASGDLYVSFSSNNGWNWTTPEAIIAATGDQATLSFVQMPLDTLRLWYGSNQTGGYRVHMAWSVDGSVWYDEGVVNLGWSGGYQYYDPTVILEPDGSLTMSYVVMSSGVYVAHRSADGIWDTNCTQVATAGYRPRIMKHTDGAYLYAYHTRTGGQYEYDVFVKTSTDLINWSDPVQITDNRNSHDPFVCQMYDGAYMVSYAKHTGDAYNLYCRFSVDALDWSEEYMITEDNTSNTQPHIWPEGHDLYLTYAHEIVYQTDHDVYFEVLDYQTGIDDDVEIADSYDLKLTCYPNPFNAAARISFVLDASQPIRLDICNILGQHVQTLLDKNLPAGEHHLTWNAQAIPSGIYFARLQSSSRTAVARLMLVK